MDLDIEQIQDILTESNLPSSTNDLKNPTEEFVVNLMNDFLRRFRIDVSTIVRPTMEQQEIMLYCEDSDIIDLINLHVAMVQICNRIYVKDLCITDITSPGSKKVRKQAKFLANFILYVNNKESEIEYRVNELQNRVKELEDLLERKQKILETKNEKALRGVEYLSVKEKLISEVQKIRNTLEKNSKRTELLMASISDAEARKQERIERVGTYKAQSLDTIKVTTELQSQIITSPEEYKERLIELEKQQSAKVKRREMMQEAWKDKKQLIELQNNQLNFIQEKLKNLFEARDIYDRLKKISAQEDAVKEQVAVLKTNVTDFQKRLETQKDQRKEHEIDEIHAECEKRLSPLRGLRVQLLSTYKSHEEKLKNVQIQYDEDRSKVNRMESAVKELEEETAAFLKNCQQLYNNEISAEKTIREQLTKE